MAIGLSTPQQLLEYVENEVPNPDGSLPPFPLPINHRPFPSTLLLRRRAREEYLRRLREKKNQNADSGIGVAHNTSASGYDSQYSERGDQSGGNSERLSSSDSYSGSDFDSGCRPDRGSGPSSEDDFDPEQVPRRRRRSSTAGTVPSLTETETDSDSGSGSESDHDSDDDIDRLFQYYSARDHELGRRARLAAKENRRSKPNKRLRAYRRRLRRLAMIERDNNALSGGNVGNTLPGMGADTTVNIEPETAAVDANMTDPNANIQSNTAATSEPQTVGTLDSETNPTADSTTNSCTNTTSTVGNDSNNPSGSTRGAPRARGNGRSTGTGTKTGRANTTTKTTTQTKPKTRTRTGRASHLDYNYANIEINHRRGKRTWLESWNAYVIERVSNQKPFGDKEPRPDNEGNIKCSRCFYHKEWEFMLGGRTEGRVLYSCRKCRKVSSNSHRKKRDSDRAKAARIAAGLDPEGSSEAEAETEAEPAPVTGDVTPTAPAPAPVPAVNQPTQLPQYPQPRQYPPGLYPLPQYPVPIAPRPAPQAGPVNGPQFYGFSGLGRPICLSPNAIGPNGYLTRFFAQNPHLQGGAAGGTVSGLMGQVADPRAGSGAAPATGLGGLGPALQSNQLLNAQRAELPPQYRYAYPSPTLNPAAAGDLGPIAEFNQNTESQRRSETPAQARPSYPIPDSLSNHATLQLDYLDNLRARLSTPMYQAADPLMDIRSLSRPASLENLNRGHLGHYEDLVARFRPQAQAQAQATDNAAVHNNPGTSGDASMHEDENYNGAPQTINATTDAATGYEYPDLPDPAWNIPMKVRKGDEMTDSSSSGISDDDLSSDSDTTEGEIDEDDSTDSEDSEEYLSPAYIYQALINDMQRGMMDGGR
ncbi:hypothetical protein BJY04DRAFT_214490 [Aspergillus karnatakaensis]|uniref:uncharacterized protein n=1 Tax=Aspergillus karnatakaensis TaxID=1810916 RepID=UPI003CCD4118